MNKGELDLLILPHFFCKYPHENLVSNKEGSSKPGSATVQGSNNLHSFLFLFLK